MEANKPEAERVRDMGADALRSGQLTRAIKLLSKSLQLYPLPGVEALLAQAERQQRDQSNENGSNNATNNNNSAPSPERQARASSNGSAPSGGGGTNASSGRSYTEEQVKIVKHVLASKEGGRGAHYRILGIQQNATEAEIKKAYRKLALKLHPDKNGAPHADEAFKAVGLAYATLSDSQKRTIYDRYGDEDPDNRGGGGANMARHFRRGGGREPSPEEIFNMFFGGGMPGGGGGVRRGPGGFHVHTNGFGFGGTPQQAFRGGRRQGGGGGEQREQNQQAVGLGQLFQLLPLLLIMILSFFNFNDSGSLGGSSSMPGNNKYYSLVPKHPFTNPLQTKLTGVKDIPYYVTDKFLRTYYRDRYQLSQVERMVEGAYEEYLVEECTSQQKYQTQLQKEARKNKEDTRLQNRAQNFELSRCQELEELFPRRYRQVKAKDQQKRQQKQYRYR